MNIDLTDLKQQDIAKFLKTLKTNLVKASSIQESAQLVVRKLYECAKSTSSEPQLALSRIFVVLSYVQMPEDLRNYVTEKFGNKTDVTKMNFLVLIGTYGHEKSWCDRTRSQGHKAIPLNEETVKTIPMVARCLQQVGFDLKIIFGHEKDEGLILEGIKKLYGSFYVSNAVGSPFIPAQDGFAIPYKIKSILGSGTCVPAGIPMVYIGFSTVEISETSATAFSPFMTEFGRYLVKPFMEERFF